MVFTLCHAINELTESSPRNHVILTSVAVVDNAFILTIQIYTVYIYWCERVTCFVLFSGTQYFKSLLFT